jgi:hypothetical protein
MSEARTNRNRSIAIDDMADRLAQPNPYVHRSLVVITTTVTAYPTVAQSVYACLQSDPTVAESEGATATYANGTGILYALNVGTAVPPPGTRLILEAVKGKWLFRFDG